MPRLLASNFIGLQPDALGGGRTHNLRLRRATRYPIAPRALEESKVLRQQGHVKQALHQESESSTFFTDHAYMFQI